MLQQQNVFSFHIAIDYQFNKMESFLFVRFQEFVNYSINTNVVIITTYNITSQWIFAQK